MLIMWYMCAFLVSFDFHDLHIIVKYCIGTQLVIAFTTLQVAHG